MKMKQMQVFRTFFYKINAEQVIGLILISGLSLSAHAALPVWQKLEPREERYQSTTPNFFEQQRYLVSAPRGVGAIDAWKLRGGRGENVKVIDIEVAFEDRHEDFISPFFNGGNAPSDTHHGTAVWGVVAGSSNGFGVTGIAHGAQFGIYGFIEGEQDDVDENYTRAIVHGIELATNELEPGDVLIIEQHMRGPDANKYTAVEFWDEIFRALKKATDKGILCVEAAGNGNSDFDSKNYKGKFDLNVRDSGCIVVGAGGRAHERLWFSNYGSRIDAFGYGEGVVTTGYGDLFNSGLPRMYTGNFSGTSSATPIVAGAVAVVSSIAKARGRILTPQEIRAALRSTGTPQRIGQGVLVGRIGNLPNIEELMRFLGL